MANAHEVVYKVGDKLTLLACCGKPVEVVSVCKCDEGPTGRYLVRWDNDKDYGNSWIVREIPWYELEAR